MVQTNQADIKQTSSRDKAENKQRKELTKLTDMKQYRIRFYARMGVVAALGAIGMVALSGEPAEGANFIAVVAAQIGVIASKPLAQYEKGRKGGKGEYAIVGEKGAELMYIPQGASIVPNNKLNDPNAWGAYGVPTLPIPAMATINPDILDQATAVSQWQPIDYDRLGQAVAKAMPKQRTVNVNVDRHGVTVQSGNDTRTYLNTKYQGQWN